MDFSHTDSPPSQATISLITTSFNGEKTIATWSDASTLNLYSSTSENGLSWTSATPIGGSSSQGNGFIVFSSFNGSKTIATWVDSGSNFPYSSTSIDDITWTPPQAISITTGFVAIPVVIIASGGGKTIATWPNVVGLMAEPFFSTTEDGIVWTTPKPIDSSNSFFTGSSVNPSYNGGTIIVTWEDAASGYPYVSSSVNGGNNWSVPQAIDNSVLVPMSGVNNFSSGSITIATWTTSPSNNIYTSTSTDGLNWTPAAQIGSSIDTAANSTILSYNGSTTIATWVDNTTHLPTFATSRDGLHWTTPESMTSFPQSGGFNVFNSFNNKAGVTVATWGDPSNHIFSSILIAPPKGFSGKQKKNNFGLVSELFNKITWDKNPSANSYLLYRNGTLIATLDKFATSYEDHNRGKRHDSYTLIASMASGGQSTPITITLGK